MVSFPFRSFKEEIPKHTQEVVFINHNQGVFLESAGITSAVCYYEWIEVDSSGEPTGTSCGWSEGDDMEDPNYVLVYYLSSECISTNAKENTHWMPHEEYWEIIDSIN